MADKFSNPASQPKSRTGIPSRLLNGSSPLRQSANNSTTTRTQERNQLADSIRGTYNRRTSIDIAELSLGRAGFEDRQSPLKHSRGMNGTSNEYALEEEPEEQGLDGVAEEEASLKEIPETLPQEPPRDSRDAPSHSHLNSGVTLKSALSHSPPTTASSLQARPASPYTLHPPIDYDGLSWPSIGTRSRLEESPSDRALRLEKLSSAVRTIFECIGEDPSREGLLQTPERYAKALLYFTKGYEQNVREIVNGAVFQEDHDELVIVRDIPLYSLCEHHMVPFIGKMHIGYIPNRRVLGLSKLARLAEMFARRLQVQERLTKQVALAIAEVLKPQGVGVVMESEHLCMVMRGVEKGGSSTTTSCMLGALRRDQKTRQEFLSLLGRRRD